MKKHLKKKIIIILIILFSTSAIFSLTFDIKLPSTESTGLVNEWVSAKK